jgi:1,4-dihydroxy-2-naphthoate octaprenyltransferase
MSVLAWLQASRLPSQSYIALPLALGQALAHAVAPEAWSWEVCALVQAFGLFDQLYIVYANDYADRDTDAQNQTATIFSGGSRVIPQGKLSAQALRRAAGLAAGLALMTGALLGLGFGRWGALPMMVVGLGLLWAYSYPPLRLSYRGGGELLQMLGVGLVLPLLGFYAQAGKLGRFPWALLGPILLLQLACAMSTALPDEPSDRCSDKRTLAVSLGPKRARAVVLLLLGGALAWLWARLGHAPNPLWWGSVGGWALMWPLWWKAEAGSKAVQAFVFLAIWTNLAALGTLLWMAL